VLKALPSGGSKEVKHLLEVLAENNRLGVLRGVVEKFDTLVRADRGEVDIVVTSATPLDNKVLSRIETAVAGSGVLAAGKKSRVVNKVCVGRVGCVLSILSPLHALSEEKGKKNQKS